MDCEELIRELRGLSSEKYKANVVKMGIPEEYSLGVSTGDVRKLARLAGRSNELAGELWSAGYHEARLLAVLVFDPKTLPMREAERLMQDVVSWDLCDHLCKNLLIKIKGYQNLIEKWCNSSRTYEKRGAFTLIASAAVHDKKITAQELDHYLELVKDYSDDDREHVKKAVSWALREIGKSGFDYQEKALLTAYELAESDSRPRKWIARDAIKELEKLVQTEGRRRLISGDSKMGQEVS
ncbi:DNA alkylation repair protein [Lachnospiraceae bacterium ASD3451]|uniref:DNA alkylation repair protein n=1 Tax=Diplocloster agilis TaxID=2850323 RepID=UPI001E089253|nr:DNA alkylation repair protein [Diplocloster agilis]MBU9742268.1 DNA alkylation repair protein [Diplocloster agilis]